MSCSWTERWTFQTDFFLFSKSIVVSLMKFTYAKKCRNSFINSQPAIHLEKFGKRSCSPFLILIRLLSTNVLIISYFIDSSVDIISLFLKPLCRLIHLLHYSGKVDFNVHWNPLSAALQTANLTASFSLILCKHKLVSRCKIHCFCEEKIILSSKTRRLFESFLTNFLFTKVKKNWKTGSYLIVISP